MADNVPVDKGSKEATFTALAGDLKLDDKIRSLFLAGPMENLEDFRYYFAGMAKGNFCLNPHFYWVLVSSEKPPFCLISRTPSKKL